MKIGIDAKWYFNGTISGRRFIQNILPQLFTLHPEVEWHIFLNRADKRFELPFPNENIMVHYVWAKLNMLSNLFVLPRYARQFNLDAVLFQTFSPKSRKFKSIVFIHDVLFKSYPQFFTWKEKIYFKTLKWTISLADRIITTTEFVKEELVKFNYVKTNQPIDIVPLGVTSLYKPVQLQNKNFLKNIIERYKLPDSSYLLFVGRLNARKNLEGIINSLQFLNNKDILLIIVGKEDRKPPQIGKLLQDEKIKNRIIFTGAIPDEDLAAIYGMAKILCFPSFAEGFGLPPLEAMASGIPVVVSNTTSLPESCGSAATYVDPAKPESIAQALNMLLENSELYQQKKMEGIQHSAKYQWSITGKKIMQCITKSVKQR